MIKFDPNKPLGLPTGTVRAVLALIAVGAIAFQWATQVPVGEAQLTLTSVIITFYFTGRASSSGSDEAALGEPYVGGN